MEKKRATGLVFRLTFQPWWLHATDPTNRVPTLVQRKESISERGTDCFHVIGLSATCQSSAKQGIKIKVCQSAFRTDAGRQTSEEYNVLTFLFI